MLQPNLIITLRGRGSYSHCIHEGSWGLMPLALGTPEPVLFPWALLSSQK